MKRVILSTKMRDHFWSQYNTSQSVGVQPLLENVHFKLLLQHILRMNEEGLLDQIEIATA